MSLSHGYLMEDKFGQLVRQVKARNLSNVALEITENVAVQFACELKVLLHPVEIVSPYHVVGHKHKPLWQASNMTLGLENIELQVRLMPHSAIVMLSGAQSNGHSRRSRGALPSVELAALHKWALVF